MILFVLGCLDLVYVVKYYYYYYYFVQNNCREKHLHTHLDTQTAVMRAVIFSDRRLHVLEVLLQARGDLDLDVRDTRGWTAVMWAVDSNSPRCLRLLLERGASMEGKHFSDESTMKEVARSRGLTDVLEVLEQEERNRGEFYSM